MRIEMNREGARNYIMKRYPDQKEIWDDYLEVMEQIFPAKDLIMLPLKGEVNDRYFHNIGATAE
jgi:hypothetical protein